MSLAKQFELNNESYVSNFTKGDLALPPAKKALVLVCMDARIDPAKSLGFEEGDVHVVRNAGGRASDAIRSIIISQRLLGTREIIIIHHSDCGMLTFKDEDLRSILLKETGQLTDLQFLPFLNLEKSVEDDIELIKSNPLILNVPITGYVYDVKTGKVNKVSTVN